MSLTELLNIPYWLLPGVFCVSAGLIAILAKPAQGLGWTDTPTTRKHHRGAVPLVGGVAMSVAILVGVLLLPIRPDGWPALLGGMIFLTLLGLYDDLRPTRPLTRLVLQACAVFAMAAVGEVVVVELGDLFGTGQIHLGWGALLFTLFSVVGVINTFNMIDGLDGLAGGIALVATVAMLLLCVVSGDAVPGSIGALLVVAMAICGFLLFNLRHPWRARASVFMGDAGSTMLGFVLSWFLVDLSQEPGRVLQPMTAVWILGLPVMDTVTVMMRRMLAGLSPFSPDRRHLHHLLLGLGLTDSAAVGMLLAVSAVFGGVGVLAYLYHVPQHTQLYGFVGLYGLYVWLAASVGKRLSHAPAIGTDRRRSASVSEGTSGARGAAWLRWLRGVSIGTGSAESDGDGS